MTAEGESVNAMRVFRAFIAETATNPLLPAELRVYVGVFTSKSGVTFTGGPGMNDGTCEHCVELQIELEGVRGQRDATQARLDQALELIDQLHAQTDYAMNNQRHAKEAIDDFLHFIPGGAARIAS